MKRPEQRSRSHRVYVGFVGSSLVLLLALGAPTGCGGGGSDNEAEPLRVVRVEPGASVRVFQVDFEDPQVPYRNTTWGRVLVDPDQLRKTSDMQDGWLNVATTEGWAIVNLPLPPAGEPPFAVYFDLGLQEPEGLQQLAVSVRYSNRALESMEAQVGQPSSFPVAVWAVEARGLGPFEAMVPSAPPSTLSLAARVTIPRTTNGWFQMTTNVQCAMNQCLSMAVANVLQYLEDMGVITIPHVHTIGLRGDSTLVGVLDTYMNRGVVSRASGSGLTLDEGVDGAFEYYADESLTGILDHRHQDSGWASALPASDYTVFGSTTEYDGGMPTFSWIYDRLGEGYGIVAGYSHSGGMGGHAVRITAAFRDSAGNEWLRYTHDALQTQRDPTDSLGLENVLVILSDLDGDGIPNLGTADRELRLVWALGPD